MAAPVFAPNVLMSEGNVDLGTTVSLVATPAGTYTSPIYATPKGKGVAITIDITAITGSLTVTLESHDKASGKKSTILASAALAAAATTVLKVYPGLTAAANTVANDHITPHWDLKLVAATGPVTATVSVDVLE